MSAKPTQNARPFDAVIFDLDGTLFDHTHSSIQAMAKLQSMWPELKQFPIGTLNLAYQRALNRAYDDYLANKITYEAKDIEKVRNFFTTLRLPTPSQAEMERFRDRYKTIYRAAYSTTTHSLETLQRLRIMGITVVILTNGQQKHQEEKAAALGILPLVDCLISSEVIGYSKPDSRAFQFVIDMLGYPTDRILMVGDSARADIMGALGVGLSALWYAPESDDDSDFNDELKPESRRVIRSINEVLYFVTPRVKYDGNERLH
ncbi:Glyceraldehyde 3-phosphate phosphatase [Colletotrichum gloeosporioides]|uniref:Glyceraldehyde 3-phosphate phosphatase n=1 Tax=Colletotrichum gloeosporioides TaxID=474922 RepID=A0A8H4FCZ1_COLGL|nr:Glyceraldehyde 3-phosphate phosphatase [Colletotrichum gloeosporioides]KAF3797988.1 Glyceraldehyde 3-phosphate phosphatase [Colletotrichum gloeosporioides]